MAEGLYRQAAGDRYVVVSAGTKPSPIRPEAILVMREIGIDISGQYSKSVDEFVGQELDLVITVCDNAKESCPIFPSAGQRLHWPFEDPAAVAGSEDQRLEAFRSIRDQIQARIQLFLGA
jgi:arsenate reductase